MKNCKYISKLRLWAVFCSDFYFYFFIFYFFVMNDIDIHQLNLGELRSLTFLVENALKKCVFLHFLSNKCIINSSFQEKTITLKKKGDFIGGTVLFFHFSLVW
jgi:hypothetical protein